MEVLSTIKKPRLFVNTIQNVSYCNDAEETSNVITLRKKLKDINEKVEQLRKELHSAEQESISVTKQLNNAIDDAKPLLTRFREAFERINSHQNLKKSLIQDVLASTHEDVLKAVEIIEQTYPRIAGYSLDFFLRNLSSIYCASKKLPPSKHHGEVPQSILKLTKRIFDDLLISGERHYWLNDLDEIVPIIMDLDMLPVFAGYLITAKPAFDFAELLIASQTIISLGLKSNDVAIGLRRIIVHSVRGLRESIQQPLDPVGDLTRADRSQCGCADCIKLNDFMSNSSEGDIIFRVDSDRRWHLHQVISDWKNIGHLSSGNGVARYLTVSKTGVGTPKHLEDQKSLKKKHSELLTQFLELQMMISD